MTNQYKHMNNTENVWTYCTLWVSPSDDESKECQYQLADCVKELVDPDDHTAISFFQHVPIPASLIENCYKIGDDIEKINKAQTGYSFLHEFTRENWGTSFDADDVTMTMTDNGDVYYTFRVLDGTPLPWLETLSTAYPELYFDLDCENEMELWDAFSVSFHNGEQIDFETQKKQKKKNK